MKKIRKTHPRAAGAALAAIVLTGCKTVAVTPGAVEISVDPGESASQMITLTSKSFLKQNLVATSADCSWIGANYGMGKTSITLPASQQAQFELTVPAGAVTAPGKVCNVDIRNASGGNPLASIGVSITLDTSGIDIQWPSEHSIAPLDTDTDLNVKVTDDAGQGLSGYRVAYQLISDVSGVWIKNNLGSGYSATTNASGLVEAKIDVDPTFENSVKVGISVSGPDGKTIASKTILQEWLTTDGNIYYWSVKDRTGGIKRITADLTSEPVDVFGPEKGNDCAGCHAATLSKPVSGSAAEERLFVVSGPRTPYVQNVIEPSSATVTHDLNGQALFEPQTDGSAHNDWDPTGQQLTLAYLNDIYVYDAATKKKRKIAGADSAVIETMPTFSSDGKQIAFIRQMSGVSPVNDAQQDVIVGSPGKSEICTVSAAGGTANVLVPAEEGYVLYYPEFSPDGKWLAFNKAQDVASYSSKYAELWIVPVDKSGTQTLGPARKLANINREVGNSWPTWSPGGRWIAFSSNRSRPYPKDKDGWDLYIASIDGTGIDSIAYAIDKVNGPGGQHIPNWVGDPRSAE